MKRAFTVGHAQGSNETSDGLYCAMLVHYEGNRFPRDSELHLLSAMFDIAPSKILGDILDRKKDGAS